MHREVISEVWHNGGMTMKPINKSIEDRGNIILHSADPATAQGFTQVPNFLLTHPRLTFGAKVTYGMFLSYAWNRDRAFPGQEKLAKELGVGDRQVRNFVNELKREKLLSVERRGLGKTNMYHLYLRVVNKKGKNTK